jgi:OsmC subfamily peroxiredoxin
MPIRKAEAEWKGNFIEGAGRLRLGSGAFEGPCSFKSRIEEGQSATNPEELVGAGQAGCFTMALTMQLSRKGIMPRRIHTIANVNWTKLEMPLPSPALSLRWKLTFLASMKGHSRRSPSRQSRTVPFRRRWPEQRFI